MTPCKQATRVRRIPPFAFLAATLLVCVVVSFFVPIIIFQKHDAIHRLLSGSCALPSIIVPSSWLHAQGKLTHEPSLHSPRKKGFGNPVLRYHRALAANKCTDCWDERLEKVEEARDDDVAPSALGEDDGKFTALASRKIVGDDVANDPSKPNMALREVQMQTPLPPAPDRDCRPGRELPELVSLQSWPSTKPLGATPSISLLTHLTHDRLGMLENQCHTWPDRVIAVLYVPLQGAAPRGGEVLDPSAVHVAEGNDNSTAVRLEELLRGLGAFHSFLDATGRCALHLEVVGQFASDNNPVSQQYPINALRNRALSLVETELLLVLDVDFVATPLLGLDEPGYKDPDVYEKLAELARQRGAIVLPALELPRFKKNCLMCKDIARNVVIEGKGAARQLYHKKKLLQFKGTEASWSHDPTETSRWIKLAKDETMPYSIHYESRYEPYVMIARELAPWADERFVGYGGNKIAYINQLNGLGFQFYVHPSGFVVHVPHTSTDAFKKFIKKKKAGKAEMNDLRILVEEDIARGSFVPVIANCEPQILSPLNALKS